MEASSCKNNDSDSILIQSLLPLNLSRTLPNSQQSTASRGSSRLQEEAKIEREIVNAITRGQSESLNPNSGQAIQIGDHHICVSFHEEAESSCKVWEWHGHVVCYNEEKGYTQEYVYGSYFERRMSFEESEEEVDEDGVSRLLFNGLNLANSMNRYGR